MMKRFFLSKQELRSVQRLWVIVVVIVVVVVNGCEIGRISERGKRGREMKKWISSRKHKASLKRWSDGQIGKRKTCMDLARIDVSVKYLREREKSRPKFSSEESFSVLQNRATLLL